MSGKSSGVVGSHPAPEFLEFDGRIKYGRLLKPGQDAGDAVRAEKRREDAIRDEDWGVVRWVWADLARPDQLAGRVRRARGRAVSRDR